MHGQQNIKKLIISLALCVCVCVCVCVEYFNVLFFINSPELLGMVVIDSIAVIALTHHNVTQNLQGPSPVLIVSRVARSLGTRSFYVSRGSHERDFGTKATFLTTTYSLS